MDSELDKLVENAVLIDLGGKKRRLEYRAKAFKALQTQFGSWVKGWEKMLMPGGSDLDYQVLGFFVFIGLNDPTVTQQMVDGWIEDLFQDEIVKLIDAMKEAPNRWLPKKDSSDPQT